MSYYTYFYPKQLTDQDSRDLKRLSEVKSRMRTAKMTMTLMLVQAYYNDDIRQNMRNLDMSFREVVYYIKEYERLECLDMVKSQLDEYGSVSFNHAKCDSEYQLKDSMEHTEEYIKNDLYLELLLMTVVRFGKGDGEYGDQTESQWLRSGFPGTVMERLDGINELYEEYWNNQFMLDNFDTKKDESDLEKESEAASVESDDIKDEDNSYISANATPGLE